MPQQWFYSWFNSPYYHLLYSKRNQEEAKFFIDNLLTKIKPLPTSNLLDVACGRGRHSVYLNQKGFNVTGFDLSEANIQYAQQFERDNLHFFVHDMRLPLTIDGFDVAFNLFTSFGYFDKDEEHIAALNNINQALKPGCILVLDYFNKHKVLKNLVADNVINMEGISFHITKNLNDHKIIKDITFEDEDKVYNFKEMVSLFDWNDFNRLFKMTGFEIVDCFGDYGLEKFDPEISDRLIFICKKTNA